MPLNTVLTGLPLSQLNRAGSHQCRSSSHPLGTSMWPYHSAARAASLVACPWENWIQAGHAGISLPTWYGAGIPGQQLSTRVRCHESATSAFGSNIATDFTCHPLFNTRQPSIPCRRCSRLERSSAFSVICFVTPYFQTTFKDTSFPTQFLVLVLIFFNICTVPLKRFSLWQRHFNLVVWWKKVICITFLFRQLVLTTKLNTTKRKYMPKTQKLTLR